MQKAKAIKTLNYIIVGSLSFFIIYNVQAQSLTQNDQLKTGIIDWKRKVIGGGILPKSYTESIKCGTITFSLPKSINISFHDTIIIKVNNPPPFPNGVDIQTTCKLGKFDFADQKEEDGILLNHQTQQWYMTSAMKNEKIEESSQFKNALFTIETPNIKGYLVTEIVLALSAGDGSGSDYLKYSSFCLYNKTYTKEFCGSGPTQYFSDITDIGSKRVKTNPKLKDYTPALIKILETTKFKDDK